MFEFSRKVISFILIANIIMKSKNQYFSYFVNLVFPACVFGVVSGGATAVIVLIYKMLAKYVIGASEEIYSLFGQYTYLIPIALGVLFFIALALAAVYKKAPDLAGGGIPNSIGILRGVFSFSWLKSLWGTVALSLVTFFTGVPLGNEGPSVQIGTAVGKGCAKPVSKKHGVWSRYSMTGGASAGFAVATGAPVSGMMFVLEEAHQRISPMLLIVSAVSVSSAALLVELLSPILCVSATLFPRFSLMALSVKDLWLPVLIGAAVGFFSVLFLYYYRVISAFFVKKLKKVDQKYKIFAVLAVTLVLGVISPDFISTGHELIISLFEGGEAIYMLILLLLMRTTLTLSANSVGMTGGIFIPLLSVGALFSALVGKGVIGVFGLSEEYFTVILMLGITACISGMMNMPLTAIAFAIEALSLGGNILYVIISAATSFIIVELFKAKSINDSVIDNKIEKLYPSSEKTVIDTHVTVREGSFAIGKQVRDVFWPANLFVLSVKRAGQEYSEIDEHGGIVLAEGDILHIRYSTYNNQITEQELHSIIGGEK